MDISQTTKQWATPTEVSEYLAVSKKTVYRMVSEGDLVGMKVRGALRVSVESLRKYEHVQVQRYALENL